MNGEGVRILLLADRLGVGGTERQVVELLKGLQRSGRFAVVLGVLDRGGDLEAEAAGLAVEVLPLRRRARFDGTVVIAVLRQTRRAGVRLVHAVGWMSGLAGLAAARCLRLPIVNASIRNAPPALHVRDRVGRWCARHSDAIVANAQAGLQAFGLAGDARARVIANGIDLARFDRIVARDGGDPSICMVANFNHFKYHLTAIRAVPHIRQAVPRARLVLVGQDAGTLAAARRLVDELGVGDAVQIVTDSLRPEPFIAASAVCVSSSRGEALSNAVMEYMALGKPVVASACAGNATLVRDGETGFLVAPQSPEALAARVIEVLRDPQRARRMGAEGRRRIEAHYALRRMVAEYEALYDQLLAASGRPG